jgi:hypothetical protein
MSHPEAEFYLILEGKRGHLGKQPNGLFPVEAINARSIRIGRPRLLPKDHIAVKIRVQVPPTAFDPISPSVLIVVPEDFVLSTDDIQVEALDPLDD